MDDDNSKEATRSGAWTTEELEYVDGLINAFKEGWLDLPSGATMRNFLAESLNCAPKRISKRMESTGYNGRQTFVKQMKLSEEEAKKKQAKLQELRERYERSVVELSTAKAEAEASKAALLPKKMPGKPKAKLMKAEGPDLASPSPRAPEAASLPAAAVHISRSEANSVANYSLFTSQSLGSNTRSPSTFSSAPQPMAVSQPSAMSAALPVDIVAALRSLTAGQAPGAGSLSRAVPISATQDLSFLSSINRDTSREILEALLASRPSNAELTSALFSAPTLADQFAAQRPPTIEEYLRQIQSPVQQPTSNSSFSQLARLMKGYAAANPSVQFPFAQQQLQQQYEEGAVRELLRRPLDPSYAAQQPAQQQSQDATLQDLLQRLAGHPRNDAQSRRELDDQNRSNKRHKPN